MKELIKVRIDKAGKENYWYATQIGSIVFVREEDDEDYILSENAYENRLIVKSDCTILDTVEKERHPSRTDDLYLHIFEKHGLSLKDNQLNEIIDIAVKSDKKENPEEWVPQVGEWAVKTSTERIYDHSDLKIGQAFQVGYVEDTEIEEVVFFIGELDSDGKHKRGISYKLCRKALPHEIPAPEPIQESEERIEKPPIGLYPRKLFIESRMKDISEAIERFEQANKEIPKDWIEEHYELVNLMDALYPEPVKVWVNRFESIDTYVNKADAKSASNIFGLKFLETIEVKRPIK